MAKKKGALQALQKLRNFFLISIPVQLCAAPCSAVQCSAVQCSAVQCSAVQCSVVQCSAVQCSAVQCSSVQWLCSAVQCTALHCTAVNRIVGSWPAGHHFLEMVRGCSPTGDCCSEVRNTAL